MWLCSICESVSMKVTWTSSAFGSFPARTLCRAIKEHIVLLDYILLGKKPDITNSVSDTTYLSANVSLHQDPFEEINGHGSLQ